MTVFRINFKFRPALCSVEITTIFTKVTTGIKKSHGNGHGRETGIAENFAVTGNKMNAFARVVAWNIDDSVGPGRARDPKSARQSNVSAPLPPIVRNRAAP